MPRHRVALIGHFGVWRDFLDAIEQRRPPRVSGAEALKVHRLIDALLTAGATGRTVVPIG
jgi:UDP-N-acetyl-2-amino-2-deoxyglucuronate dehydrogenase